MPDSEIDDDSTSRVYSGDGKFGKLNGGKMTSHQEGFYNTCKFSGPSKIITTSKDLSSFT